MVRFGAWLKQERSCKFRLSVELMANITVERDAPQAGFARSLCALTLNVRHHQRTLCSAVLHLQHFLTHGEVAMTPNLRTLTITLVLLGVAACKGGEPMELMGGKFSSMQQCLSSIQSNTGIPLQPVTDTPDQVSGFLQGTKRFFSCTKKSTGTQGTFWEGVYDVPK
jgi:hypothetical protein